MERIEFWYNVCNLFVQAVLHILFSTRFTEKKVRIWYFPLYIIVLYVVGIEAAGLLADGIVSDSVEQAGALLVLLGMNYFVFGNSCLSSGIVSLLAVYVPMLCYGMVNSAEMLILPHIEENAKAVYFVIFFASIMSVVLSIFCYQVILSCFAFEESKIKTHVFILVPACVFFLGAEFYISRSTYGNLMILPTLPETGRHLALLILQAAGLAGLLSTLYAYRQICKGIRAQTLVSSLKQEIHAQKNYVEEAQMRYEKTRAFRHDVRNHLSVLEGLIRADNMEQAGEYLQKLETVTEELSFSCQTGNAVVDILLGEKMEIAKGKGIETEVSVMFPKECQIDSLDLCVIFANAADNAVHACGKVKGSRYIRIAGERQGDFYMLEFENSCRPGPMPQFGTGLMNVKASAEKYKGAVTIEKTDDYFRLNVLLDMMPDDLPETFHYI